MAVPGETSRCPGSFKLPSESSAPSLEASWTGVCPACGKLFELGYAGYLPAHDADGAEEADGELSGPADPPGERKERVELADT